MTKTTTDIEKFQYDHIFNLILSIFKFSEKKYGNFVKDVIRILLEFEKNGETIIDVDNSLIIFELFEDGWICIFLSIVLLVDKHSLKPSRTVYSINSPPLMYNKSTNSTTFIFSVHSFRLSPHNVD